MAARPDRMNFYVADSDIADLQRIAGWDPEPRQPPRRVLADGLEIAEIGRRLNISDSAVKQTLYSAFRKIRRRHPELRLHLEH